MKFEKPKSSLWGIDNTNKPHMLNDYDNFNTFASNLKVILTEKHLQDDVENLSNRIGLKRKLQLGRNSANLMKDKLDSILSSGVHTQDQICWLLVNHYVFFTKDKQLVVDAIYNFVEENKEYNKYPNGLTALEMPHVKKRFLKIANDISDINEEEHPYFVFKESDADREVTGWFKMFNEEKQMFVDVSLDRHPIPYAKFVNFVDGRVDSFVNSTEYYKK